MRRLAIACGFSLAAGLLCCGGDGAIRPPISDSQDEDDSDQPTTGGGVRGPMPPADAGTAPVALPGGAAGIGFDDMGFSPTLGFLLVPAGRTGDLDLLDPSSEEIDPVGGFSTSATYAGGDTFGVTSADEGNALVYAVDRTTNTLAVVDPRQKAIVARTMLAATPGYVRYVAPTNEVWVTEPGMQQIEVFTLDGATATAPVHSMTIGVGNGPESLEIDATHEMAFTHQTNATVAIDVASHEIAATWPNGCTTSRGLAVDSTRGWVISACEEGLIVVLAQTGGATLGTAAVGGGVDRITYDSARQRLYVPTPAVSEMDIIGLAATGVPQVLGVEETTNDAHCAITAGGGAVYVCAPSLGELLFIQDPF
ncbi:MAG: hypothetical protein ABSE49_15720 [Polyangiaceae bacterium]